MCSRRVSWAVALLLLGTAGSARAGNPSMVVERPLHDFGTVAEGELARHTFEVKNAGDAPLEIRSVSASCGCTAAAPKEKQIAPGASGRIEVTFDTTGRPGRAEKTVAVVSDDPKKPNTTLTIKVEVVNLLAFEPAYTYLAVSGTETGRQETWLTGQLAAGAKPKIVKVEPPGPTKVQLIQKREAARTQWGLRFEVGRQQAGQGMVKVQVATGVPRRPRVEHLMRWSAQRTAQPPAAGP
jgi:Protein of unknown function (DUF1573)